MHIDVVPNRGSPPAILLRESYREDGKTKKRTLANLSAWPAERIEQLRAVLRGERLLPASEAVEIVRALPHGHVLAALGTARRIDLDGLLPRRAPQRRRDLALALIIARLLDPAAKLATARMLDAATATSSLGEMLGLGRVTARELYATLDWLASEQAFIETTLARRHLKDGALLLYDVTSTYLEGRCCELAQYGYSRDHRGDRPQLVIGLLCAGDGCPVAVEVFDGNTADPATLPRRSTSSARGSACNGWSWWAIAACSPAHASSRRCARPGWIGSPRYARRRSRRWPPRAGRCSPRCSTSATWPRSPARTIRANAWWCARTPSWPPSGRANGKSCWRRPRRTCAASRRASSGRASRCAGRRRSARRSVRCWAGAEWPSTLISGSPTTASASASAETMPPSPPRQRWTASMCCAPTCRSSSPMPRPLCVRTRAWPAWNTLFVH